MVSGCKDFDTGGSVRSVGGHRSKRIGVGASGAGRRCEGSKNEPGGQIIVWCASNHAVDEATVTQAECELTVAEFRVRKPGFDRCMEVNPTVVLRPCRISIRGVAALNGEADVGPVLERKPGKEMPGVCGSAPSIVRSRSARNRVANPGSIRRKGCARRPWRGLCCEKNDMWGCARRHFCESATSTKRRSVLPL